MCITLLLVAKRLLPLLVDWIVSLFITSAKSRAVSGIVKVARASVKLVHYVGRASMDLVKASANLVKTVNNKGIKFASPDEATDEYLISTGYYDYDFDDIH